MNQWLKYWRRRLKARLPYVRRRQYVRLQQRYDELLETFAYAGRPAGAAAMLEVKPVAERLSQETCLFVTFAPDPEIKSHVYRHVAALQELGIDVVLVINSTHEARGFFFENGFVARLKGLYVRENAGYDFAAWAHLHAVVKADLGACTRLLLVNDSIVGPLNAQHLKVVMGAVRECPADIVGLTEFHEPRLHLQSFFLVFQGSAVHSAELQAFFSEIRCLPSKDLVIALYESFFTQRMTRAGYSCKALFPGLAGRYQEGNDMASRWAELIEGGFPYIKTSVLERCWGTRRVEMLVPQEVRETYKFSARS